MSSASVTIHALAPPPLCLADDATFWPWRTWTDLARWPDKPATVVVMPIAGLADWGLGHPLDLEETLLLPILKKASAGIPRDAGPRLLTLPPLRFATGVDPGCAFALEPPSMHRLLDEVAAGVAASGFTRVVLYNASPWNEELVDVAARDIRIARGLQMFCIHLSALGHDLHPTRSSTRRAAQTLATWLLDSEPEPEPKTSSGHASPDWPETERVRPLLGAPATLAEAREVGPAMLDAAGAHLRSLLGEIAARPPLAHGGVVRLIRS